MRYRRYCVCVFNSGSKIVTLSALPQSVVCTNPQIRDISLITPFYFNRSTVKGYTLPQSTYQPSQNLCRPPVTCFPRKLLNYRPEDLQFQYRSLTVGFQNIRSTGKYASIGCVSELKVSYAIVPFRNSYFIFPKKCVLPFCQKSWSSHRSTFLGIIFTGCSE